MSLRYLMAGALLSLLGACAGSPSGDDFGGVPGALCGDPRLQGRSIGTLTGQWRECSVPGAVEVVSAAGVRISPPAKLNCRMARRLADWMENGMQIAAQRGRGQRIASIQTLGTYSCRRRNGLPSGRLSEHARANAIDIAGFSFADGLQVNVERGWRRPNEGRFLRELWRSACGRFGTVLGPDSDRFHYNHFHLDAAKVRSAYCR